MGRLKRSLIIRDSYNSDGLGVPSVSIFFSYCDKEIKCPNCQNKELQKDGFGYGITIENAIEIVKKKYRQKIAIFGKCNIAILGGEPLAKPNREFALELVKRLKEELDTEIILYTWRTEKEIIEENIDTSNLDKIVCGEYIEELKNEDYILGSTNQYILNNKLQTILKYEEVTND